MEPICEACGAIDEQTRRLLVMKGMTRLPDPGKVFRPPMLCQPCREALLEVIRGARQAGADLHAEVVVMEGA